MGVGGKLEAAVLLRNDHAEEALVLDVAPGFAGQVVEFVRDLPVVDQAAGFLDLVVHERLLGCGQRRLRIGVQFPPVGLTAEQFAFPPDGAGFQRIALGIRHLRQDLAIRREQRTTDHGASQGTNQDQGGDGKRHRAEQKNDRI